MCLSGVFLGASRTKVCPARKPKNLSTPRYTHLFFANNLKNSNLSLLKSKVLKNHENPNQRLTKRPLGVINLFTKQAQLKSKKITLRDQHEAR